MQAGDQVGQRQGIDGQLRDATIDARLGAAICTAATKTFQATHGPQSNRPWTPSRMAASRPRSRWLQRSSRMSRAFQGLVESVLFSAGARDPQGGWRGPMPAHRASRPTRRAPAGGKPFGPGGFGPNPSASGSAVLQYGRRRSPRPWPEAAPAERFQQALKGSRSRHSSSFWRPPLLSPVGLRTGGRRAVAPRRPSLGRPPGAGNPRPISACRPVSRAAERPHGSRPAHLARRAP